MKLEELIYQSIKENPLSFDDLHKLAIKKGQPSKYKLNAIIEKLTIEKKIYFRRKERKYYLKDKNEFFRGVFRETRHDYAFVENEEGQAVFIPGKFKLNAVNGDTVNVLLFPLLPEKNIDESKRSGRIVRVVKRNGNNIIIRKRINDKGEEIFLPDDFETKYTYKVLGAKDLEVGSILITRFKDIKDNIVYVDFKKKLGNEDEAELDYLVLAYKNNIPLNFLDSSINEAKAFLNENIEKENKRRTFPNEIIYTIDGIKSKDLDDAVSVSKTKSNGYNLKIHIADVSHYVKPESSLDYEAYKRCNSIYLLDKVFPMLPEILSNNLCSLNPNQKKLTLTCEIELDKNGEILNYKIYQSAIISDYRLTYEEVDKFLLNNNTLLRDDKKLSENILIAKDLSEKLRIKKLEEGMIDFNLPEIQYELNSESEITNIWEKYQTMSEKMVEDFMVLANRCVADFLTKKKIPGIFRVHKNPKNEDIERFNYLLESFSLKLGKPLNKITSKDFMNFLIEQKESPYISIIKRNMIQTMEKAQYDIDDFGHYALGVDHYLHFTSPIRRYADLIVHRQLKSYFKNNNVFEENLKTQEEKLKAIALECSTLERTAMMFEWKLKDIKKVRFMKNDLNKNYKSKIVAFSKHGIFVELDNLIQGMIFIKNLNDDEYYYDETKYLVIGKNTNKSFHLGQELNVRVLSLNLVQGLIDLEII